MQWKKDLVQPQVYQTTSQGYSDQGYASQVYLTTPQIYPNQTCSITPQIYPNQASSITPQVYQTQTYSVTPQVYQTQTSLTTPRTYLTGPQVYINQDNSQAVQLNSTYSIDSVDHSVENNITTSNNDQDLINLSDKCENVIVVGDTVINSDWLSYY